MNRSHIIRETAEYVRKQLQNDSTGHDWWHVHRVWQMAIKLAKEENADLYVVELAALLHDIDDWKFHKGDDPAGPAVAIKWLKKMGVDEAIIDDVCDIIECISFKGAGVPTPMRTIEGMVVQDADRLDAIGAIGIARAFAYGGYKGRALYDPNIEPEYHESFGQYRNSNSPTLNHFAEKLLFLKDLMNTATARKMAQSRHDFMHIFLKRFEKEWAGLI